MRLICQSGGNRHGVGADRRPGRDPLKQSADERRLNITGKCAFYVAALDCGVETAVEGFEACCVCVATPHTLGVRAVTLEFSSSPQLHSALFASPVMQHSWSVTSVSELKLSMPREERPTTPRKQVEIPDTTLREQEGIEVTGWRDPAGHFTAQPTKRLTIKQISESTGMSIEEVKRQLSFPSPGWS